MPHLRISLVILPSFAALIVVAGCNIVGPIAVAVSPPPTKEAEYELADRPTAVFVDDLNGVLSDRSLRSYIGDKVAENLLRADVFEEHIPVRTRDVMAIVGTEGHGELVSLGTIGERVDVEQIIYVEMMSFRLVSNEEDQPMAQAHLRVKVVDLAEQRRVFPTNDTPQTEDDFRTLFVDLPSQIAFQPHVTRAGTREAEIALCDVIADRVAKLFYEHEIRPIGGRIDPERR